MSESNPASVWLESARGERVPVQGRCFLGRSADCQVVLPDAKVSRRHALLQAQHQNEFWLIDLGSANGTYLNGRRLAQPSRVSDGDRVSVGGFDFTFHLTQPLTAAPVSTAVSEATIHEVRNLTCWLLLADIENSTQLMRKMPGADGPRLTGPWFTACREVLEQYHGAINKYLGDGFLAYWPAGPQAAAWVADALRALKDLQDKAEPLFRVVVYYGNVSAGGAASLGEESLAGNEVNFTFRAEKLAGALGQPRLLSAPAQEQLRSLLPSQAAGSHRLPGFEGEFAFFSY